jgi:hypothetical protein
MCFTPPFIRREVRDNHTLLPPIFTNTLLLIAPSRFEDAFTEGFKDEFAQQLGTSLMDRIDQENSAARAFLEDVYISGNPAEFGLGFCVPIAVFDDI